MKTGWKQNEELGKVTASMLVIVGRQDGATPSELAEAIANSVKGSELRVLEGSGHFPWIEKEDEC
jgi:pimeloyl-ACP methyl ester carboxylesterase